MLNGFKIDRHLVSDELLEKRLRQRSHRLAGKWSWTDCRAAESVEFTLELSQELVRWESEVPDRICMCQVLGGLQGPSFSLGGLDPRTLNMGVSGV